MLAAVQIEPSIYTVPAADITDEQFRFMRFHSRSKDDVWTWRLILGSMYLRVECGKHHSTIDIYALGNLVERGLMCAYDDYRVDLTQDGWDAI